MKQTLLLAGLFALLISASCQSEKKESEPESKLLVTSPLKTDTSVETQYVCQIHSIRHIDLRAQERGYLQKIYVDEGQHVKAGQLLFQIMPQLYEAEMNKAGAEVDFADIEFRNTKRLADSNVVAPGELAMARAKLNKAKAELALYKVHLNFTEIRAPFDGIIDKLQVRQGSLISEGDLLTTLADNSKMWVYFNVPEAEYLNYKSKSDAHPEVHLLMANNEVFSQSGIVETIEADFDNETGNIPFRATFPNPDGLLRHGETGNILMKTNLKNALIIPQKATFEVLDKKYVFVVDKDSRVRSREITIGSEMNDLYAVTSGLAEGDKILLEGLRKVKEGDKISYDYQEPRTIMNQLRLHAE
jgi:membrane fusion protein (multidrug efflux system)